MKQLKLGQGISLPVDVAGEATAILATRGAGKSYTSAVLTEELIGRGIQVVVVDPAGVYWGLRSSADGKGDGLAIYVLGGLHGDLPLEPTAGKLIADLIVDSGHSFVLDLSGFDSKADQTKFVTAFADRLYARKGSSRTTLHLILDEADEFAPQKSLGIAENTMLNRVARIVRRGRSRGLGITMITQRSATLNKDVLDLVETLIVMRMPGPRDREQVKHWISVKDLRDELGVDEQLPGLPTGTAFVWSPVRGMLKKTQVRRIRTFDSYRTPKPGETAIEPAAKMELDLAALGQEIQATVEREKAKDPTALRARVKELERDVENERRARAVAEQQAGSIEVKTETVEVLAVSDGQLEVMRAIARELQEAASRASGTADEILAGVSRVAAGIPPVSTRPRAEPRRTERAATVARHSPPGPVRPTTGRAPAPRPAPPTAGGGGDFQPSGPQQRILDELARLAAIGITPAVKTQLALFAKASPKSSAFTNNLGALRSAGLIDYPAPGTVALTHDGVAQSNPTDAPVSSSELHEFVFRLVGAAKTRLLEVLIVEYPNALPKVELAERAGASPTSSAFTNNLGSLRSLGLLDYPQQGWVAAEPILFLEDA